MLTLGKQKMLTVGKFENKTERFDYNEKASSLKTINETAEHLGLEGCCRHIIALSAVAAGDKLFSILVEH